MIEARSGVQAGGELGRGAATGRAGGHLVPSVVAVPGAGIEGHPLVLGIGDDHLTVGELDLETRPVDHDLGRRDHRGRPPVGTDQFVADGDVAHGRPAGRGDQRGVEGKRLTDAGPGGNDDHLTGVQSVRQVVQVGEPGRHAGSPPALLGDRIDLVHGRLQQLFEDHVILGGAALGDVVDLGLRPIDDLVDLAAAGIALVAAVPELDDPGSRLDQAAQNGLLRDDLGVEGGVGRGRHGGHQRVQIDRSADPAEGAVLVQLCRDGDGVGRLAPGVEIHDRVEDQ